jgi:hypothetical protein
MGLADYLVAGTDAEHCGAEQMQENLEIDNFRDKEIGEVTKIFEGHGLKTDVLTAGERSASQIYRSSHRRAD